MKRFVSYPVLLLICLLFLAGGCGERKKSQEELILGNWININNNAYILLIINSKGNWQSSIRIADARSKIVNSKGSSKGVWFIEEGKIAFNVMESDIEDVWEKNGTIVFDIIELTETIMRLKDESDHIWIWNPTNPKKAGEAEKNEVVPMVAMGPISVNLNKNRSYDKDRYLCLNLNIVLKELMPDQKLPAIHPKAREAVIIFLSSLVFNDVKNFNEVQKQAKKLTDILNPYMEGAVKEVDIDHVIVVSGIDKVEEFMIEHTKVAEPQPAEGEQEKS